MDVKQLIEKALLELEQELEHALDGLSTQELVWRPSTEANAIGFIFWHVSRAEDSWINGFALKRSAVFERDGWPEKWNMRAQDEGYGFGPKELEAFPTPPIDELWQYHRDVRQESLDYLRTLSPKDLDHMPSTDDPGTEGYTIGRMFSHLICEIGQHVGHICYLRGLQRGINQ